MSNFIIKEYEPCPNGTHLAEIAEYYSRIGNILFCEDESHRRTVVVDCSECGIYCRLCNARPDKDMLNLIKLIQPYMTELLCEYCQEEAYYHAWKDE